MDEDDTFETGRWPSLEEYNRQEPDATDGDAFDIGQFLIDDNQINAPVLSDAHPVFLQHNTQNQDNVVLDYDPTESVPRHNQFSEAETFARLACAEAVATARWPPMRDLDSEEDEGYGSDASLSTVPFYSDEDDDDDAVTDADRLSALNTWLHTSRNLAPLEAIPHWMTYWEDRVNSATERRIWAQQYREEEALRAEEIEKSVRQATRAEESLMPPPPGPCVISGNEDEAADEQQQSVPPNEEEEFPRSPSEPDTPLDDTPVDDEPDPDMPSLFDENQNDSDQDESDTEEIQWPTVLSDDEQEEPDWSNGGNKDIMAAAYDASVPLSKTQGEDFRADPLKHTPWIKSNFVNKIISDGFDISVDINMRGKSPPLLKFATKMEEDYVLALERDGVISRGRAVFNTQHFFLTLPGKLRLLFDGRKLNCAVKTPPHFNMKSHATVGRLVVMYSWAARGDVRNMFFSIPLSERCKPYFGFRTVVGDFFYNRLPFGFNWSGFVSHICFDEVFKEAIARKIPCTHFSDDFTVFGHTQRECWQNWFRLVDLITEMGWRLNLSKSKPPSQKVTVLGVRYDLKTKTSAISTSIIRSLQQFDGSFRGQLVTTKHIASVLGTLVFCNQALPGSLALLSPLLCFTRHCDWNRLMPFEVFRPFLVRTLNRLFGLHSAAIQVALPSSPVPEVFHTDATVTQLGIYHHSFRAALSISYRAIYKAEALAVVWLLLQDNLPQRFCVFVDNQALFHALNKGRSNTKHANWACILTARLRARGHIVSFKWLPSEKNMADAPSRWNLFGSLFHLELSWRGC